MRLKVQVLVLGFLALLALAQFEDVLPKTPRIFTTENLLQGGWGQEIPLDGSCQTLDSRGI